MKRWWIVVGLVCLVLVACGGDDGSSGVASLAGDVASGDASGSGEGEDVDPEEARLAWAECMRENGIDVPDPGAAGGPGEGGMMIQLDEKIDPEQMQAAEDECRHHIEGVFDEPSEAEMQEAMDNALAFAQCMRDNGVEDHPDPDFGEDGRGMTLEVSGEGIMDDPDFEAAEEECRELLPGAGRRIERRAP